MSKLAEFRAAERALADQLALLESLKKDSALQKEIEFEQQLKKLMETYGKSLRDVVAILDPESTWVGVPRAPRSGGSARRPRALKAYKNPHTGEVVHTKGGNHTTLKAWKAEHGKATVESWLQE